MALTAAERKSIVALFTNMFDMAPGATYLQSMADFYEANGRSLSKLSEALAGTAEFKALFAGAVTNDAIAKRILANFDVAYDTAENSAGYNFYKYALQNLNAGFSKQSIIKAATEYFNQASVDPIFASTKAAIDARTAVAEAYSTVPANTSTDVATLRAVVNGADTTTTIKLTTGIDNSVGNSEDNIFLANLSDNSNTLQSGDVITGGAGNDTLIATLGSSASFAILPTTTGVETIKIQAQSTDANGSSGDTDSNAEHVRVDAQNMSGVSRWTNTDSRATLDLEDIRIDSHKTTLEWKNADPGDVDYNVYFNPANITAPAGSAKDSTLIIKIANVLALKENSNPISGFKSVVFKVGAKEVTADISAAKNYADVKAAIESALKAAGITTVTVSEGTPTGVYFSTEVKGHLPNEYAGDYTPIILKNSGPEALTKVSINEEIGNTTSGNIVKDMIPDAPTAIPSLTQVNVILDNVGRGSKSGDFLAGSMSTGGYSGSKGIQQFNVTVENNSKLASMSSTNDTLEVVNVRNGAVNGSLSIDNLTDVRVFDASAMKGNVTLNAELTANTTAKYLNRVDTAAVTADNSEIAYTNVVDKEFSYDLGSGNDNLALKISHSNLDGAGTTTREDFVLEINGGEGNDSVTLGIDAGATDATNWYLNSKQNANLRINTQAGNDTIRAKGAGDFIIDAGEGNDTVYVDNSGDVKAKWAVNAGQTPSANAVDLLSDGKGTPHFLYNGKLTVTYSAGSEGVTADAAAAFTNGYEVTVDIPTTANFTVTQAEVNQAIKKAINEDPVLSKLLVAKDGPAYTIVIESLVDGAFDVNDINIAVSAADVSSYTTAQQAAILNAYKAFAGNSAATIAMAQSEIVNAITDFNNNNGMTAAPITALVSNGTDSSNSNDSIITLGAGDDVVVLSTADASNNTLVFTGYDLGKDTVVNFSTTGAGRDFLNFAAYLTGKSSATGSVESQATIPQTLNTDASTEANSVTLIRMTETPTETFAALNGANLLAAINSTNVAGSSDYANITAATLDAVNTYTNPATGPKTLVGGVGHAIVMVENGANLGEYKIFDLTFDGTSTNKNADFTDAKLIATVDFGASLSTTLTAANLRSALSAKDLANYGGGSGGGNNSNNNNSGGTLIEKNVSGNGQSDASTGNIKFVIGAGDYTHTISGFAAGDILDFPPSKEELPDLLDIDRGESTTDGTITIQYTDDGDNTASIVLTGLAKEPGNVDSFRALFGADSLI